MQIFNMIFKCTQCRHQNVGNLTVPPSWEVSDGVTVKCSMCDKTHEVALTLYPVDEE